ncbi:MAG TPA: biotin--[acetyl-CoA-carboxylase] ligase [Solirubrobacteraceae bacterium]|nr:biotin--[acetyl-CoA-carboxylase] ligase [Solirubrobacteraceae bacterium]
MPAGDTGTTGGGLGHPRVHLRVTDSTNERARELALAGAPHGTLVTAAEQTAGRGRQGRSWVAPAGGALLCSLVLRPSPPSCVPATFDRPPALLSLIAGVAVCDAVEVEARLKWPNDVVVEATGTPTSSAASRDDAPSGADPASVPTFAKLAGILVEGRPQENWAVLGIGVNVAVRRDDLPAELREHAASLGLPSSAIEPTLQRLIEALQRRLAEPAETVLEAWRERDALLGRAVVWAGGEGRAHGIDDAGRLLVRLASGAIATLDAGEVHLGRI